MDDQALFDIRGFGAKPETAKAVNGSPGAPGATGVLVLSFDDNHFAGWEKAMPLFEKYGAHATFFVSGDIDDAAVRTMKRLSAAGHSVGLHGQTHANADAAIAAKGAERYWAEEIEPQSDRTHWAHLPVTSFAYPNCRSLNDPCVREPRKSATVSPAAVSLSRTRGCRGPGGCARHRRQRMKAGFFEVDITPRVGVGLCGFGPYLNRYSIAVRDPLKARAAAFEQDGARAILVSCDLIGVTPGIAREARRRAAAQTGVAAERIMVHCTHTHSGPNTGGYTGWGNEDEPYNLLLPVRIAGPLPAPGTAISSAGSVT